jgi:hypothetical protein
LPLVFQPLGPLRHPLAGASGEKNSDNKKRGYAEPLGQKPHESKLQTRGCQLPEQPEAPLFLLLLLVLPRLHPAWSSESVVLERGMLLDGRHPPPHAFHPME